MSLYIVHYLVYEFNLSAFILYWNLCITTIVNDNSQPSEKVVTINQKKKKHCSFWLGRLILEFLSNSIIMKLLSRDYSLPVLIYGSSFQGHTMDGLKCSCQGVVTSLAARKLLLIGRSRRWVSIHVEACYIRRIDDNGSMIKGLV